LEQALVIASRENSQLLGLHVINTAGGRTSTARTQSIEKKFKKRCEEQAVNGHLTVLKGDVAKVVNRKALLADLIVLNLEHPPEDSLSARITSGMLDIIRRSGRSVLATPHTVAPLNRIMLAYVDSPTSREALFLSCFCLCFPRKSSPNPGSGPRLLEKEAIGCQFLPTGWVCI
jgi:hypothetical protein